VLQNAVIVLGLQSYLLVVQGITLLVLIKLSIVICAAGHSLGIPACGFVVASTQVINHSNAVLVG
jgi:hypothetical protein